LFCFEDPSNWDASDRVLGIVRELSTRRESCMGFGSMMFGLAVPKFYNIQ